MAGELVLERFRVAERIGAGGMGTVYRAFDERLRREVAIKDVPISGDAARVRREAQAAARLNHPAIVALYELGLDGDRALLVSELVPGATLDRLAAAGELSDRDVAEAGLDVCSALDHAHARGVIHRDLKPQNVIVRDDDGAGRVAKLMDFGIARIADAPGLTASGEVIGTLAYMAPEQADGAEAGPAADVYSLALTLYALWAGENPVAGRTPALTAKRIGTMLAPLADLRPDLPPDLTAAVDDALHPDPELRAGLAELTCAIERAAPRLDPERVVPAPPGAAAEVPAARGSLRLRALALVAVLAASVAAAPGSLALGGFVTVAAAGFGVLVARRHLALALTAALLWAACLSGVLTLSEPAHLDQRPALIAVATLAGVALARRPHRASGGAPPPALGRAGARTALLPSA